MTETDNFDRRAYLEKLLSDISNAKLPDGTPVRWSPEWADAIDTLIGELAKMRVLVTSLKIDEDTPAKPGS